MTSDKKYMWRIAPPVTTALALVVALSHKSSAPTLLGMYSMSYAVVLAGLVGLAALVGFVCLNDKRWDALGNGARGVGWKAALTLVPPVSFALLVVFFLGIRAGVVAATLLVACPTLVLAVSPTSFVNLTAAVRRVGESAIVQNLALLSFALMVSIVAIEAWLRIASPHLFKAGAYVYDRDIGFRFKGPGTNEMGFRDTMHPQEKPAGNWRLASIGDSFCYGLVPIEENYNSIILDRLPQCGGKKTEVLNFGTPQTGPNQYTRVYANLAVKYSPDATLLGFYIGNDFFMHPPRWREIVVNGRPEYRDPADWKRFLPNMWVLSSYSRNIRRAIREEDQVKRERGAVEGQIENGWSMETVMNLESEWLARLCSNNPSGEMLEHKAMTEAFFIDLRDRCSRDGRKLIVALFPDQFQIDPDFLAKALAMKGLQRSDIDLDRPQRWLVEFGAANGIPVVDLLPAFRAASNERLYLDNDIHWNKRGNEIAGDEIAKFLAALPGLCR